MADSLASSATAAEEKTPSVFESSLPGPRKTDANMMPDTADEVHDLDVEKAGAQKEDEAPPGPMDPRSFPDGGLQAWLSVSGSFACLFCSFGWINGVGIFQAYYQTHQLSHYSPSTVSWIPSMEIFVMFAGGPIIGKLYDTYGPRHLILIGTVLHVFGLMMASISSEYYQFFLSQGVCSPIGASLLFYPAMSSVGTWFYRNRALAFGVMASGSSLGGVIFPISITKIIDRKGFGWSMRANAFIILALMIYANLTVRSRLPPVKKPWTLMEFVVPYKELPFALLVLAAFLFFFGMFIPFTFVILSAQYYGMSANLSTYLISILNAVSIFGRTLPGAVADRVGRFNVMIATSFLSTILVLGLWLPARGNVPFILFSAFYGFTSGAFVSLAPAMIAQISDVRQLGVRTGSMFFIVSFAALVGNPIAGQLVISDHGSFMKLQIFCGVTMAAGSVVFIFARASLVGFKLAKV